MDNEDTEALEPSSSQVCDNENSNDSEVYLPPDESSNIEVESSNIFHSFQMSDNTSEAEVIIDSRDHSNNFLDENFLDIQANNQVSDTVHHDIGPSIVVADASFASNFILESENSRNDMIIIDKDADPGCSSSSSQLKHNDGRFQPIDLNLGSEALSNTNSEEILFIQARSESEDRSSHYMAHSSKQADSNCLEKGKGKYKSGKGLKGKRCLNHDLQSSSIPEESSRPIHNKMSESDKSRNQINVSNKHSLFAIIPSRPLTITTDNDNRSNTLYDGDSSCDEVYGNNDAPVQTSSPCHSAKKLRISLNDEESFMVASSSEGIPMEEAFYVKYPKSSEDALVSSSTGQLDQLPGTSMNFQVNDVSNSSLLPSPINPPVLDSTVDSTSGQNISSPYSEMNEDDLDFHCRLEGRNEISTSEHHLPNIDLEQNVMQRSPEASHVTHYIQDYLNLSTSNLNSSTITNNPNPDDNNSAEASALIPASSPYMQQETSAVSHIPSFPGPSDDTSDATSPLDSENLNNLAANESMAFPVDTSTTSDVNQQNLLSLDMAAMEVPSSSLAATTSSFQTDNFDATGSNEGGFSSSSQTYRSTRTLAQINENYILGITENSLSSEETLPADDVMPDGSLQLNERECLQAESDGEASSQNFQNSLELGLVPQNLGAFAVGQPDQQILMPPSNLLEVCPNMEASNIRFLQCSQSFEAGSMHNSDSGQQDKFQRSVATEKVLHLISSNFENKCDNSSSERNREGEGVLSSGDRIDNSHSEFNNNSNDTQQHVVQLLSTECLESSTDNNINRSSLPSTSCSIIKSLHMTTASDDNSGGSNEPEDAIHNHGKLPLNIHSLFNSCTSLQVRNSDPSFDPDGESNPKKKRAIERAKMSHSLFNKSINKPDSFNAHNKPVQQPPIDQIKESVNSLMQDSSCSQQLGETDQESFSSKSTNEISNSFNYQIDTGFWCSDCEKFLESKCIIHRVQTIMDKPILSRAWASLPAQYLLIKQIAATKESTTIPWGVFCRKSIPKRTQFGPLEGTFSEVEPRQFTLVFRSFQNKKNGFIDISDEATSNWMRFVRAADTYLDMNCIIIEEDQNIYFLTTTNLPPKAELQVGYSKQYAVKYGYDTLTPTKEEEQLLDRLRKTWSCYECDDSFETSVELQTHLVTHDDADVTSERKFRSKRGRAKRSKHSPSWNSRKIKSSDDSAADDTNKDSTISESYDCTECSLYFHTPELLNLHLFVHSVCDNTNNNNGPDSQVGKNDKYTCPQCSSILHSRKEIGEHVKQHSFLVTESFSNSYKCGYCYKSYSSKDGLDSHSKTHKNDSEKPHACWLCHRRFCTQSALGSHIKSHTDGAVTLYDCPICSAKIDNVSDFKLHFPTHCIDGSYTCPSCSKKFPTYFQIRRHIRSYHSSIIYPCTHCGKQLVSLQKLRFHLAIHLNKREFGCLMCPKRFNRKDKMKEHLKRIHSKLDEPKQKLATKFVPKVNPTEYRQFTYKCDQCMLGFKRRGMLVNHMSKRHPDIPVSSVPDINKPIMRTRRTYACQHCVKSYASMTKRKQHIIKNHPGSELPSAKIALEEDVFKVTFAASCQLCPRQYMTKAKLLQHQRKDHSEAGVEAGDHSEAGPSSDRALLVRTIDRFSPDYSVKEEEEITDSPIIVTGESVSAVLNPDGSLSLRPIYANRRSSPEVSCPARIPVEGGKIFVRNSTVESPIRLNSLSNPSLVVWQPSIAFNSSNI